VPDVILIRVSTALRRENMKRRELQIRDGIHRPAVALVCGDIIARHGDAALKIVTQRAGINTAAFGCFQRADDFRQRGCRGGTDCGVLSAQQLLRFRRPRQELAIEADPICFEFVPDRGGGERVADDCQEFRFHFWMNKAEWALRRIRTDPRWECSCVSPGVDADFRCVGFLNHEFCCYELAFPGKMPTDLATSAHAFSNAAKPGVLMAV